MFRQAAAIGFARIERRHAAAAPGERRLQLRYRRAVLRGARRAALAHAVGVGRGTDLLLYLACVTFLFTTIGLHLRLAGLRDQYVALARQIAIDQASARERSHLSGDRPFSSHAS